MKAIIGKRVRQGSPTFDEIRNLSRAAGYEVVEHIGQTRKEDPAYGFGKGQVEDIAERAAALDVDALVVDNRLGPYQTYNIGQELPPGVEVIDRFTLILEIFANRASTRKAQLQVELAELRYELPRASAKASLAKRDEHPGFMGLGEYDESRERDIKSRISRIRDELDQIAEDEANWRAKRRESGFELVALAGYTNAGKSTLLRRLANELDIDSNKGLHDDLEPTAESKDRLFTTLGTTTRNATIDGRDVLVTDTVGFIRDLPHWLVESFRSTLEQVYHADLVLLVADISEPLPEIREKLVTCHDTLYERNEAPIVTVFNKTDELSSTELEHRLDALTDIAPNPIPISAIEGTGIDELSHRISQELPARQTERLVIPMTDDTMGVISWIHDNADVQDVVYADSQAVITFRAKEPTIKRARGRAANLRPATVD